MPMAPLPRLKVLVADDDPLARSLVASALLRMNADVVEVGDGEEAWVALRKGDISAALLDLEMPGFDGFELISCVRGHPTTRHIPIIVITSRDDKRAIDRAQQAGATSYITKPVHWSAFRTHIGYLLDLMRKAEAGERDSTTPPAVRAPSAVPPATEGRLSQPVGVTDDRLAASLARASRRLEAINQALGVAASPSVRAELSDIAGILRKLSMDHGAPPSGTFVSKSEADAA